jgi:hypothetical protein
MPNSEARNAAAVESPIYCLCFHRM